MLRRIVLIVVLGIVFYGEVLCSTCIDEIGTLTTTLNNPNAYKSLTANATLMKQQETATQALRLISGENGFRKDSATPEEIKQIVTSIVQSVVLDVDETQSGIFQSTSHNPTIKHHLTICREIYNATMAIWVGGMHDLWKNQSSSEAFNPNHLLTTVFAKIGIQTPEQLRTFIRQVADTKIYVPSPEKFTQKDKEERLLRLQQLGAYVHLIPTKNYARVDASAYTEEGRLNVPLLRALGRLTWTGDSFNIYLSGADSKHERSFIDKSLYRYRGDDPNIPTGVIGGVPEALMQIKHVNSLSLRWLGLKELPQTMKPILPKMQFLSLSYNFLEELPTWLIDGLTQICTLNAEYNHLRALPSNLLKLKGHLRNLGITDGNTDMERRMFEPVLEGLALVHVSEVVSGIHTLPSNYISGEHTRVKRRPYL